jgi:hypothetical protein
MNWASASGRIIAWAGEAAFGTVVSAIAAPHSHPRELPLSSC